MTALANEEALTIPSLASGTRPACEPEAAAGSTCTWLPFCHWNANAAAAPFSPSESNFTGPCTLFRV